MHHDFGLARPATARGYVLTYRQGQPNCCPGCGGEQWHIGRQMAECAYCATALPLADPGDRHATAPRPVLRRSLVTV